MRKLRHRGKCPAPSPVMWLGSQSPGGCGSQASGALILSSLLGALQPVVPGECSRWEERESRLVLYLQTTAKCCLQDKGRGPLGINSLWTGEIEQDRKTGAGDNREWGKGNKDRQSRGRGAPEPLEDPMWSKGRIEPQARPFCDAIWGLTGLQTALGCRFEGSEGSPWALLL